MIDVDQLSNEIRRVDGSHSLGAGALAEALLPFIERTMTHPTGDALEASAAQVRHKKRGSTYNVIGIGKMQSEHWWERNPNKGQATFGECDQLIDMREVVVYRSTEDGSLWVRPREEFEDGRFEPALSPVEQAPQPVAVETRVRVNPDQERMIRDIVRSAYDRGYNDSRNVSATPGDNAPGYRGQDAERAHSDELLARFNRLAAIVESPAPTEAPPVESQAAEVARLPKDTIALVVAAREVLDYLYGLDGDRVEALDRAVEAFADRVPFDDEPDAALAAEGSAE